MSDWSAVLHFWFGELSAGRSDEAHRQRWFEPDERFDRDCARFETLLTDAKTGALAHWLNEPEPSLAFIIVCDQLPRNIYRGTVQAFAWDPLALAAARVGIQTGFDRALGWDQRSFYYMPFEHSEDLLDQHTAVGLFMHLRSVAPGPLREAMGNNLRFAQRHRDLILQFGRFPHRNAILGRAPTAAEQDAIVAGNDFGQRGRTR